MDTPTGKLAVVTGASSGIGYELAKCCARENFDLIVCAEDAALEKAAADFRSMGCNTEAVRADLASQAGVAQLWKAIAGRSVDLLCANAGKGLGKGFLDQELDQVQNLIDLNIGGTISLIHKVGRQMRDDGSGRILITGSIAGQIPGSFQAVYNGSKAFLDSFSFALGNELRESGVTVTCLMPGPTDTDFFREAGLEDTRVGAGKKQDPKEVAQAAFAAAMNGEASVVPGFMNKVQSVFADLLPDTTLAEMHRRMAKPGTADK